MIKFKDTVVVEGNTIKSGATSFGMAIANGTPVVLTKKGSKKPTKLIYRIGTEKEAMKFLVDFLSDKQAISLLEVMASEIGLQLIPNPENHAN